ncbi:MAG TPA: hypothetical protein VGG39_32210 [Polyangiaceae bacterium]|jgi:hypothetical protein
MHLVDALAIMLLVAATTAFVLGERALARAEDLSAMYWLVVGIVSLQAAVQVARPGKAA